MWRSPRTLLFTCSILDLLGLPLGVALLNVRLHPDLSDRLSVLLIAGLVYNLFGWLFGSYTLLRLPWLQARLLLQRLLFTAIATLVALVLLAWWLNISDENLVLLKRSVLLELMLWQSIWSLLLRLCLRWLAQRSGPPVWQLIAAPEHQRQVLREWQRNPFVAPPRPLCPSLTDPSAGVLVPAGSDGVVLGAKLPRDFVQTALIAELQAQGVTVATLEELAQRQLERLPPALLPDPWLQYHDLPWSNEFSLQRNLKRFADVAIASLLLCASLPFLLLAALLIRLEDRGPVLFVQQRSGWLGRPFSLFKLRTMRPTPTGGVYPWTVPGDYRITCIGSLLRRSRLDELPQLINVIRGEMSLIGPRPEQPDIEADLERRIPHYRKRHWMLPGMSGWAQVCGPAYASNIEEAELKLSYDLYYLRNFSFWLDLLILAKTIKTLLKVRGR